MTGCLPSRPSPTSSAGWPRSSARQSGGGRRSRPGRTSRAARVGGSAMPSEGRPSRLGSAEEALMSFVTGLELGPPPGSPDDWVVGDARASAEARVDVYRYMYGARLVEALQSQYPCVAAALGAGRFAAVVHGYAARHPSRHPSIRELGRQLADDLEAGPSIDPELPAAALADLARLEWARADVFDAVDEDPLPGGHLRGVSPDAFATLGLERIEASRLVTVQHPVCT